MAPSSYCEGKMPVFDLSRNGGLDAYAPFKVLAVMCHPKDVAARERMVGLIERETGKTPRRQPLSNEEFEREFAYHRSRAVIAGATLLTQLQLSSNGHNHDLNLTFRLVSALQPRWEQSASFSWSRTAHINHSPHSRRKILAAIREYQSVAHIWAAMIYGQHHDRRDIWPGSNATLPLFLAVAVRFLDMARALPASNRRSRGFLMLRSKAWTFSIPPNLARQVDFLALPLHPDQLKIINELQSRK
jgi:hypothetical protein